MSVQIKLSHPQAARIETGVTQLRSLLTSLNGVSEETVTNSTMTPRAIDLAVISVIVSSAAVVELARALRDFVRRTRLDVQLTSKEGEPGMTLRYEGGSGSDLTILADFLRISTHSAKTETDNKTADSAVKDVKTQAGDLKPDETTPN